MNTPRKFHAKRPTQFSCRLKFRAPCVQVRRGDCGCTGLSSWQNGVRLTSLMAGRRSIMVHGPWAQPCGQARWMCPPSEGRWSADHYVMSMDPRKLPMTSLGCRSATFPLICTVAGAFSRRRAKKRLGVGPSLGRWHHSIICDATDPKMAPNGAWSEAHGLQEVVGTPTMSCGHFPWP